jgi:hypothetical protein
MKVFQEAICNQLVEGTKAPKSAAGPHKCIGLPSDSALNLTVQRLFHVSIIKEQLIHPSKEQLVPRTDSIPSGNGR